MRNIDHQYSGGCRLEIFLLNLKIVLCESEIIDSMVDLGISDRVSEVNLIESVAELKFTSVGSEFIPGSRLRCPVVPCIAPFQFPENFFE